MYALLVCDDNDETAILSLVLQRVGLAVTIANDLERAMRSWAQRPADMVVVALRAGLPGDQVRRVRSETDVPLAILTNTQDEDSLFAAFEAGADVVF
ncbi:MAG: DNA-binding response regulator, partial [Anaerolineae bacterium]|nr:DNA-binding response regulator [Anaerolineae bacterium]